MAKTLYQKVFEAHVVHEVDPFPGPERKCVCGLPLLLRVRGWQHPVEQAERSVHQLRHGNNLSAKMACAPA